MCIDTPMLALLLATLLPASSGAHAAGRDASSGRAATDAPPAVRRFVFRYRFELQRLDRFLDGLEPEGGAVVRMWIPLAQSTRFQQVISPFATAAPATRGGAAPAEPAASKGETAATASPTGHGRPGDAPARAVIAWPAETGRSFLKGNLAVLPGPARVLRDPVYGNRVLFVTFPLKDPQRPVTVEIPYCVARMEVRSRDLDREPPETLSEVERRLFLKPNAKVPVGGKPLELLKGLALRHDDPLQLARDLYRVVEANVTYKKVGSGWGQGDVLWVCDSRYGNCTDFHSLFISLARAQGIPAKFVIGFPVPRQPASGPIGGYHCWAWFFAKGRGWRPVDISEADKNPRLRDYYFGNLTPDRLQFTTGRDIDLNRLVCEVNGPAGKPESAAGETGDAVAGAACEVPRSVSPPLNYFVYPHVEIGQRVLDPEFVVLQMSYCNVDVECLCAAADGRDVRGGR